MFQSFVLYCHFKALSSYNISSNRICFIDFFFHMKCSIIYVNAIRQKYDCNYRGKFILVLLLQCSLYNKIVYFVNNQRKKILFLELAKIIVEWVFYSGILSVGSLTSLISRVLALFLWNCYLKKQINEIWDNNMHSRVFEEKGN